MVLVLAPPLERLERLGPADQLGYETRCAHAPRRSWAQAANLVHAGTARYCGGPPVGLAEQTRHSVGTPATYWAGQDTACGAWGRGGGGELSRQQGKGRLERGGVGEGLIKSWEGVALPGVGALMGLMGAKRSHRRGWTDRGKGGTRRGSPQDEPPNGRGAPSQGVQQLLLGRAAQNTRQNACRAGGRAGAGGLLTWSPG